MTDTFYIKKRRRWHYVMRIGKTGQHFTMKGFNTSKAANTHKEDLEARQ